MLVSKTDSEKMLLGYSSKSNDKMNDKKFSFMEYIYIMLLCLWFYKMNNVQTNFKKHFSDHRVTWPNVAAEHVLCCPRLRSSLQIGLKKETHVVCLLLFVITVFPGRIVSFCAVTRQRQSDMVALIGKSWESNRKVSYE